MVVDVDAVVAALFAVAAVDTFVDAALLADADVMIVDVAAAVVSCCCCIA